VTDPPVLLLDEPTIGLDVEAARTVKDWVIRLARDEGKTVLLTTHQLATAQELSDRIAVISRGTVIADLPTGELLSRYAEDRFEVRAAGPQECLAGLLPAGARADSDRQTTTVTLPDTSQEALHAFLGRLRASSIPLLSVTRAQPDLEDVFLRLIGTGDAGHRAQAAAAAEEQVA
jgi:ABC-2 type transport system ATP-binding protein